MGEARPRVAIRNCARSRDVGATWGDTYFASSFAAAFGRRGLVAEQHFRDEWDAPHAHGFEVVVHLRGVLPYTPRPGATNVMWIISHAEDVTGEELDAYDLVLVASTTGTARLRALTSTPVHTMLQATDPHVFRPPSGDLCRAGGDVVVVANARWPTRRGPRWLMESGIDFELYGTKWDAFPEQRFVRAEFVPNDQLSDLYATAGVVVADQWEAMARDGFVANRLFDVAAAGGFCITDGGPGVREVFGDLLPTYTTRAELAELVQRYLADPDERARRAAAVMRLVRREHTFDARVATLLSWLDLDA